MMKVKRAVKMEVQQFEVEDIIKFKLKDGEKVEAMAMQQTDEGMIFMLVDCLEKEYSMKELLAGALNGEILDRFPDKIREQMIPIAEEKYLRLATEKEVFGKNLYSEKEPDSVKRFKPMKIRRNRITSQGKNGCYEWWWLQNKVKSFDEDVSIVDGDGYVDISFDSTSRGVRPLFCINNL